MWFSFKHKQKICFLLSLDFPFPMFYLPLRPQKTFITQETYCRSTIHIIILKYFILYGFEVVCIAYVLFSVYRLGKRGRRSVTRHIQTENNKV